MKYKVWNKTDKIIVPTGAIFEAEEWIAKYPVAQYVDIVCGGGTVNGGIFAVYDDFVEMYRKQGCDFTNCETQQDYLDAIEAFEDAQNQASTEPTAEERIASALEYQVMASLPDEEEE